MSMNQQKRAPVEGKMIAQSRRKTLYLLAFLLAMLLLGIIRVWAWWTDQSVPLLASRAEPANGISGGITIALAALLLILASVFLFAHEKLVIAADRLQLVRRGEVDVQIPFRNIKRIGIADEEDVWFVGIMLIDLADPETVLEASGPQEHWHYRILDVYESNLDEIHRLLAEAFNGFSNPPASG